MMLNTLSQYNTIQKHSVTYHVHQNGQNYLTMLAVDRYVAACSRHILIVSTPVRTSVIMQCAMVAAVVV